MSERINDGDQVKLVWNDGEAVDAEVLRTPAGPGDMWQFRRTDGQWSGIWAVNVYSLDFCAIWKPEAPCHDAE